MGFRPRVIEMPLIMLTSISWERQFMQGKGSVQKAFSKPSQVSAGCCCYCCVAANKGSRFIDLHASRVGHGFHLFSPHLVTDPTVRDPMQYTREIVEYVARERICVEVCLTSNLDTMPELQNDIRNHAFKHMIANNLCVTLCTDNTTISGTDIVQEYKLATQACELNPRILGRIALHGFKKSFFPGPFKEKADYVQGVWEEMVRVGDEHGYDLRYSPLE